MLTGGDGDDQIDSGFQDGGDVITGGDGADTLAYDGRIAAVNVNDR